MSPLCRWHLGGCCLPAVQLITGKQLYLGSILETLSGTVQTGWGQLPTAVCAPMSPTVTGHSVLCQTAFSPIPPLKVFGYILKLALRELCFVM